MVLFTGYTFEIDLEKHRRNGVVPAGTDNPRFFLFLLDRGRDYPRPRLLAKYRGAHPMDEDWPDGIKIWCTDLERRRWTATQNDVLTRMRAVRRELLGGLRARRVPAAELLRRCRAQVEELGAEHEACAGEVWSRVHETLAPPAPTPGPLVFENTPERRARSERNRRAMGYHN
ncbi:hypothetical protein [Streptomyces tendae]|uniref:hypothetical protein n=1 Tax=Streptomyces tendae TaxID=1932 RepID=UPI003851548F